MEFKRKQSTRVIFPCRSCGTAMGRNSIKCSHTKRRV